jgi:16S rRNA (cytosine967-C5)-methyltransferase
VEPATGFVPDECVTDEGFYATLPHRHGIDGAFGVRLRRAA